jgi:hypothetical protein
MNTKEFRDYRKKFLTDALSLSDKKSDEYTISNPDRLYNFKHVAERIGITPEQALMPYVLKHMDAICNDAKTGNIVSDETVEARAHDICNYMILYSALKTETTPQPNDNNTKRIGEESSRAVRNGADGTKL